MRARMDEKGNDVGVVGWPLSQMDASVVGYDATLQCE
jgi:hypothetical protein